METKVVKVSSDALMNAFLAVPYFIYGKKNIPIPVERTASFFSRFNPVFQHLRLACFVALEEGRPVGRVCASADMLNPRPEEGFWGCFECQDNPETAKALFASAAKWLKEQNKTVMLGPATLNSNQMVGLLIEGFDQSPLREIPFNPPYYQRLVEESGFDKNQDLACYRWDLSASPPQELQRVEPVPGLVLRPANYRNIPGEARIFQEFHNMAMSENWGFIPITFEDAQGAMEDLSQRVPSDLIIICQVYGKTAGMLISIPYDNSLQGSGRFIRFAIGGLLPQFRQRGLHVLLMEELFRQCKRLGFTGGEGSQVSESNVRVLKAAVFPSIGREIIRAHRVYSKLLD